MSHTMELQSVIKHLVGLALDEDLSPKNLDLTTDALISDTHQSKAYIRIRERAIFCGRFVIRLIRAITITFHSNERPMRHLGRLSAHLRTCEDI